MPAPLLPVLHGAFVDAKVLGKVFLRQSDFLPNGPDIEGRRDMHPILASVGRSGGVRLGLTGAGEYPTSGFRHRFSPLLYRQRPHVRESRAARFVLPWLHSPSPPWQ